LVYQLQPAYYVLGKLVFYAEVAVYGQYQVGNLKVAGLHQLGIYFYQAFGVFKLLVYLGYQLIVFVYLLV
jgi:hypothetical protein